MMMMMMVCFSKVWGMWRREVEIEQGTTRDLFDSKAQVK